MEDTARDLVEDERLLADMNGVASVGATLVTDHPVGAFGDDVDKLALPLVAPLGADDDDGSRVVVKHSEKRERKKQTPRQCGALVQSTSQSKSVNAYGLVQR